MREFHLSVPTDSRVCPKNVSEAVVYGVTGRLLFRNKRNYYPSLRKISWRRKWQPNSHILAWEIPWTEEPGGLQSKGLQRVRHDRALTHTHTTLAVGKCLCPSPKWRQTAAYSYSASLFKDSTICSVSNDITGFSQNSHMAHVCPAFSLATGAQLAYNRLVFIQSLCLPETYKH